MDKYDYLKMNENNGVVSKRDLETQFEWKITDFFSVVENKEDDTYNSPYFMFADLPWYFQLVLQKGIIDPKCMEVVVRTDETIETDFFSVECTISLRNRNGTVEKSFKGIQNVYDCQEFALRLCFKLSDIYQRRSTLAPSGVVTITCTLKRIAYQLDDYGEPKPKKLKKFDTLSENFKHLFGLKESCDTTLQVKDVEFCVHRAVLMARSSVFSAMFLHETSEKQTGIVTIPDCDPDSFRKFLKYLYCGKIKMRSYQRAISLYETSDKYDVQELKIFCKEYLIENLRREGEFCDAVILADRYNESKLLSKCQDVFNEYFNDIVKTTEWECLMENNYRLASKLLKKMPKVRVVDEW